MLPKTYAWLDEVPELPRIIVEALKLYGIHEGVGSVDNPTILAWAHEVGVDAVYGHDSVPWCGLFAALVVKRAGKDFPNVPLWALNWEHFGQQSPEPGLGDVLVFKRDGGGHVGFYVAEDAAAYHVLGGNEGDQVNIVRILKTRCVAVRRPYWKTHQPIGVQPFHVEHLAEELKAVTTEPPTPPTLAPPSTNEA